MNTDLPIYIDITNPDRPLISGISNVAAAPGPTLYSGSPRRVSLCFVTPPTTRGAAGTVETTNLVITLSAKRARSSDTELFTCSDFTAEGSGANTRYVGVLDTSVPAGTFADADQFGIIFELELKDPATTPITRIPFQFGGTLIRKIIGDSTGNPAGTYLTEEDATARYLSFLDEQSLTAPAKLQAWQNIGGTTFTLGLTLAEDQAGFQTIIGLGTEDTPQFRGILLGPTDDDSFYAQGEQAGVITVSVTGSQDATVIEMDATNLEFGMYVFDDFPEGTTITDITGSAPYEVTFSQGKLTSGTSNVRFSTNSTPLPRLGLIAGSLTVFSVDHRGNGNFVGNLEVGTAGPKLYADGSATIPGDLWMGDTSRTGQGWLFTRTGLFGYDSVSANKIVFDTETGAAEVASLYVTGNIQATNVTATTLYSSTVRIPTFGGWTLLDENGDPLAVITDDGEMFISSIDVSSANAVSASIGTIYIGTYNLVLGGDITFTATGRALVQQTSNANAFSSIKQAATSTATGVVREWCRTGNIQLSNLTESKVGTASATVTTPVGYALQSGTTSTTGYAARRSAPSNNVPYFEGRSAGVIPWATRTVEGEVLLIMETGWDAGAVFRLHMGRTIAFPTGATAHASHPQSFEIRYSAASALTVIGARSGATTSVTSSFTPTLGTAFRLRWVVAGGTILVYVNGSLVATNTGGPNADSSSTANAFHMGVENGTVSVSSEAKTSIPVLDIY